MCIVTFPIIAIFRIVIELKTISVYSAICWMHKICTRKNNNLCEFSCAKLSDVNGRKICENWFVFAGDIFRYFRVHYKVACCKFSFTRWRCLNCMKKVLSLVAEAINSCKKKLCHVLKERHNRANDTTRAKWMNFSFFTHSVFIK